MCNYRRQGREWARKPLENIIYIYIYSAVLGRQKIICSTVVLSSGPLLKETREGGWNYLSPFYIYSIIFGSNFHSLLDQVPPPFVMTYLFPFYIYFHNFCLDQMLPPFVKTVIIVYVPSQSVESLDFPQCWRRQLDWVRSAAHWGTAENDWYWQDHYTIIGSTFRQPVTQSSLPLITEKKFLVCFLSEKARDPKNKSAVRLRGWCLCHTVFRHARVCRFARHGNKPQGSNKH